MKLFICLLSGCFISTSLWAAEVKTPDGRYFIDVSLVKKQFFGPQRPWSVNTPSREEANRVAAQLQRECEAWVNQEVEKLRQNGMIVMDQYCQALQTHLALGVVILPNQVVIQK